MSGCPCYVPNVTLLWPCHVSIVLCCSTAVSLLCPCLYPCFYPCLCPCHVPTMSLL